MSDLTLEILKQLRADMARFDLKLTDALAEMRRLADREAAEKREVHVTHEQRYTDIELARWIAARLRARQHRRCAPRRCAH